MAYGLRVENAAGNIIVDYTSRLLRIVANGTVTVSRNSYVDVTISGMANDDSWTVGLNNSILSSFYQDWYYTKSTNNLRIGFNSSSGSATQAISYYVFRT